jgi:glycerol kinase
VSAQAVLAIDQGTSGTKAIVVDPVDGVIAVAEEAVRPSYLPGGGVEQDPDELLASVLTAGRRALALAGRPVACVSLANQGETVLAWDPVTGAPLSSGIVWQDRRSEPLVAELQGAAAWVAERSGLVLDPYFSAPKMAWLRRNVTTEGIVTTTDSWLIHHLSGELVTDASTASRSLLMDLDRVAWDPELLELFGWSDEILPRIVACDETIGTTTAFGAPITVGGLVVDQQAALLAEGCTQPGLAKCTFGTGAFLLANTGDHAVRSAHGLTSSVAWQTRSGPTYCLDGQVYTAASAVRWMQELGLIGGPADMDRLAATDAEGVLCVPALAGLAAPWWRSDAKGAITGLTLATGPGHVILAVLQGIAAQVTELMTLVGSDLGSPVQTLRVDGGLVNCRTLMQATADLSQVQLECYSSAHATALGAAALGRLALDTSRSIQDVGRDWTPTMTFEPQWTADRAQEHLGRWRAAVTAFLPPQVTA